MKYLLLLGLITAQLLSHSRPTNQEHKHYSSKTVEARYHPSQIKYNRKKHFGTWIDADKDGQNTRAEVLIQESLIPVTFKTSAKKLVIAGKWRCPFTGKVYTTSDKLDIDHIVPLKEAWVSGASNWSKARRIQFANDLNDPDHLIAVYRGANRSKGAKDPGRWLPPNTNFIQEYIRIWVGIKTKWGLSMDKRETEIIQKWMTND